MTPQLALQAAAVYASALVLSRLGAPAERRATLVVAAVLVLALPAVTLLPHWTPAAPAVTAPLIAAVTAIQEPVEVGAGAPLAVARAPGLLGWAWAIGVALAGLRLGADLLAVRRLRASARDRSGDVATSDAVAVPLVIGAFRPLILLPPTAASWSAARRAEVIAHERAHVAGRDNLWLLVANVAACVHWFNPLAWLAVTALRETSEHRADEVALADGADPVAYARTLVDLARRAPTAGLAMARPSGLEGRIRAVLGARRPVRPLRLLLAVGAVVALAVGGATVAPSASAAGRLPYAPSVPERVDAVLAAEADRLTTAYAPDGIALMVLDPRAGTLLGQVDRGGLLDRAIAPGSVLKPFTVAAALEAGVDPSTPFTDGDMAAILACSSNAGMLELGGRVGRGAVAAMYERVGLSAPSTVSLDELVLGGGPWVSPRRVARAWLELAGTGSIGAPRAAQVRGMLIGVTEGEHGTARAAAVAGMHVAGKTGTAPLVRADGTVDETRMLTSFVGLAPAEDPSLLVLVMVAGPHTDEPWGGKVAGPAFANIVSALLR